MHCKRTSTWGKSSKSWSFWSQKLYGPELLTGVSYKPRALPSIEEEGGKWAGKGREGGKLRKVKWSEGKNLSSTENEVQ